MKIPVQVTWIIRQLNAGGYKAWLVGGAPRDYLLGSTPKDWDVATDAPAPEIMDIFAPQTRCVPSGLRHGTVTVVREGLACEVTQLRAGDLPSDLGARDFTINALAWDPLAGLIDPWGGENDIHCQLIRATGSARARFGEDPLRMLRAVRFAVSLGFEFARDTYLAIKEMPSSLAEVSHERIRDELVKILVAPAADRGLAILKDTGLLPIFLPEIAEGVGFGQYHPNHHKDVFGHTLLVVAGVPPEPVVRLAALFHDVAKPQTFSLDDRGIGHFFGHDKEGEKMTGRIMDRLRFDSRTIKRVKNLVGNHTLVFNYPNMRPHKLIRRVGLQDLDYLFALQRSDKLGGLGKELELVKIQEMEDRVREALGTRQPLERTDLVITGADLAALGYDGREIGITLERLLDLVAERPELNKQESLLRTASEWRQTKTGRQ